MLRLFGYSVIVLAWLVIITATVQSDHTFEEFELREQLQIKSLKVGFNKVFGYYIEIPNTHKDKVPDHFIRKQTLTTAERYITTTLKEKETILLNAQQEQANLEKRYFSCTQW